MRELRASRVLDKQVIPIFLDIRVNDCTPERILARFGDLDWGRFDGGKSIWEEDITWVAGITGLRLEALDGYWDKCIDETVNDAARLLGRPLLERWLADIEFSRLLGGCPSEDRPYQVPSDILAEVLECFTTGRHVFLWGMVGIGKTALARHIANLPASELLRYEIRGVLWSTWREPEPPLQILQNLCRMVDNTGSASQGHSLREAARMLKERLRGQRWLIILDDVWDSEVVQVLADLSGCRLLLTSQVRETERGLLGEMAVMVPITPARLLANGTAEAVAEAAMKEYHLKGQSTELTDVAREVARACGFMPALILSAAVRLGRDAAMDAVKRSVLFGDLDRLLLEQARFATQKACSVQAYPGCLDLLRLWRLLPVHVAIPERVIIRLYHDEQLGRRNFLGVLRGLLRLADPIKPEVLCGWLISRSLVIKMASQLYVHPLVTAALQIHPTPNTIPDLRPKSLAMLVWYGSASSTGAARVGARQRASEQLHLSATQCDWIDRVRDVLLTNPCLTALWVHNDAFAFKLLKALVFWEVEVKKVRKILREMLMKGHGPFSEMAAVAVLRIIADADMKGLLADRLPNIVDARVLKFLIVTLEEGLDASPRCLKFHLSHGADIVAILLILEGLSKATSSRDAFPFFSASDRSLSTTETLSSTSTFLSSVRPIGLTTGFYDTGPMPGAAGNPEEASRRLLQQEGCASQLGQLLRSGNAELQLAV